MLKSLGLKVARARGILAGGQTNKQRSLFVGGAVEVGDPPVKVEAAVDAVANRIVVELDPDQIKFGTSQDVSHLKAAVLEGALRCGSDQEVTASKVSA